MKLTSFKYLGGYDFILSFENGDIKEVNLKDLIGDYVSLALLDSARVDKEWGCLEFDNGLIDIEPKTLYQFAQGLKK